MEENGKTTSMTGSRARITVYTTAPCARCLKAKNLLQRNHLAFEEVNLVKDPAGRKALVELTGQMTFPQIVVGDHPVGGLDELEMAEREGRLGQLTAR